MTPAKTLSCSSIRGVKVSVAVGVTAKCRPIHGAKPWVCCCQSNSGNLRHCCGCVSSPRTHLAVTLDYVCVRLLTQLVWEPLCVCVIVLLVISAAHTAAYTICVVVTSALAQWKNWSLPSLSILSFNLQPVPHILMTDLFKACDWLCCFHSWLLSSPANGPQHADTFWSYSD